jgi:hypothetical protein
VVGHRFDIHELARKLENVRHDAWRLLSSDKFWTEAEKEGRGESRGLRFPIALHPFSRRKLIP